MRRRLQTGPAERPAGRFDRIVLSEFPLVLAPPDLAAPVQRVGDAIEPGGDLVPMHWLGVTDYPTSGDEAAEDFIVQATPFAGLLDQSGTAAYRLDVPRAGAAA
ncbi:hypothetical protein MKK88_24745 [Methylobacterium sp. E-005]|uniref:hypothetical protein n=1 Tax=Methylobacterium sp. E-005 TaxID=2836549 RepID=UPI001FBBA4AC|nr:hypothetical protein [Methylobacterium sp. E-005]MCJ2089170.1 hypothetical protein [Methylobacterium sp. E-005]